MAVKLKTKPYTFPSGVPIKLHTVFGLTGTNIWIHSATLRAARTNTGDVYWSDSDGGAGGFLGPGEAATIDYGEGQGFLDEIQISGTTNDQVFITLDINRNYFEL